MALRLVWPTIATTGHVVELRVVQAVEQVDGAGPGGGRAHPDLAGELRVADRFEGGHLLVPGLDELGLVVGPPPGGEQAVDAVARRRRRHARPPTRAAAGGRSRRPSSTRGSLSLRLVAELWWAGAAWWRIRSPEVTCGAGGSRRTTATALPAAVSRRRAGGQARLARGRFGADGGLLRVVGGRRPVEAEGQRLGQVHRPASGVALLDLGAAAEPVGDDQGAGGGARGRRAGRPVRRSSWTRRGGPARSRSCRPGRSTRRPGRRLRVRRGASAPGRRRPSGRRAGGSGSGRRRRGRARGGRQSSGASWSRNSANVVNCWARRWTSWSSGISSGASERNTAVHDGSSPTIGVPASSQGRSTSSGAVQHPLGGGELAGGDPGEPAAHRAGSGTATWNPAPSRTRTADLATAGWK